ncbi:MAG: AAA family ATPase [Chloroflexi bacterium]|nr:AAA family ATPase [Chloroflexota bacterium]
MISRVAIQNFKSIGEPGVDLELKPLTLLVGPNGGGKSSILEGISVAIQHGITGRLVSFPSWTSILHNLKGPDGHIDIYLAKTASESERGFRTGFGETGGPHSDKSLTQPLDATASVNAWRGELGTASLISSVRGNVPYSGDARGNADWVGVHGENLLLLLALIFGQLQHRHIEGRIAAWGQRFGINDLNAGFRGGAETGSEYRDNQLQVALDLALASAGTRQILTVITQLFWAPKGSLLMIEEPEISLHPKAQIDVLEMFAEAVTQDDKQILATTHSHILLQALGYVVSKGWLSREDIAVYHVEKGKGGTKAKQLPLNKSGYIKNWVPSYSKVERQLLREWAKTLPRK